MTNLSEIIEKCESPNKHVSKQHHKQADSVIFQIIDDYRKLKKNYKQ